MERFKLKVDSLTGLDDCEGKTIESVKQGDNRPFPYLFRFTDGTQLFLQPCCCAQVGPDDIDDVDNARDLGLIDDKQWKAAKRKDTP